MSKCSIIILLISFLIIAGCGAQCETDCTEYSLLNETEMIPNPLLENLTVKKRITRIIAELTTLISEKISEREVEQTTLKEKTTISVDVSDMVGIINKHRETANLEPLKISEILCEIAQIRAKESSAKWSHARPDGSNFSSLMNDTDIAWNVAGENLARHRNATASDVTDAWIQSESHRANLLNPRFKKCGIAEYYDGEIRYISIIFIG